MGQPKVIVIGKGVNLPMPGAFNPFLPSKTGSSAPNARRGWLTSGPRWDQRQSPCGTRGFEEQSILPANHCLTDF